MTETINRFKKAKVTKSVKFMAEDIDIVKLTVNQVIAIQELSKKIDSENSDTDNISVLSQVIRFGAPELASLNQEEMNDFPMEELVNLSNAIMSYSGLGDKKGK